jgi:curved DNA-binding protein CbpA
MGNQTTKSASYDQYYEALKQNKPINTQHIDPYEVLGVSKNYTWDELVNSYRRLAKLVHPDKGGSELLFNTVTDCFKFLAHEYKKKEVDKPHHVLKQNYINNQPRQQPTIPAEFGQEGSFNEKFNKVFDENKLEDDDNIGYGHLMASSSKTREDIEIPKLFTKYNDKKFHETFEKNTPLSKDVIIYKEPEPLVLAKKLQFTELGGKVDDFSNDPSKKTSLQYTDYMKAHTTTRLVDPRAVQKRKEYRSVEDYESDRAKITTQNLTDEELRHQKEIEEYTKRKEEERLERLKYKDQLSEQHYNKVNSLFLNLR